MLIIHNESISFDKQSEWKLALDFQKNNPEWEVTEETNTVTYTKQSHFMYVNEHPIVPIVRCPSCTHHRYDDETGTFTCTLRSGAVVKADGFCSEGERILKANGKL